MEATCYGGGDIAGAIFGTLLCAAALVGLAWWLYQKYWKGRKGMIIRLKNKIEFNFIRILFRKEKNSSSMFTQ